ncbi:MAG: hypothetical protein ACJA2W_002637 [Planctomycetota bacterium]|jgi:hypothetical protein
MQAAEYWLWDDVTDLLDSTRSRRIPIQRLMRPFGVVIRGVGGHGSQEVHLPHRDDLIRALAPDAPDQPLDEWVTTVHRVQNNSAAMATGQNCL